MRAREFLIEAEDAYSLEKARIEHPEDMVLTMGSTGATQAIAAIRQMITNPETISIKPDGKPAIVWGRDDNGFIMADKHMFAKGVLPHSFDELTQVYNARKGGGREDLITMMGSLWSQFETSLPNSFRGFLFGDLLYSQQPPVKDGNYVFQPNTVVYSVPANSDLGQNIARSTSGICVHTYFGKAPMAGPEGKVEAPTGRHISKLPSSVNNKGQLMMVTDQFTVPPKIKMPPDVKAIESFANSNGPVINKLLDESALITLKIKSLPELLKKYANSKVKARNFDGFGNDFIEWMKTAKVSEKQQENIVTHLKANAGGFKALCQVFIGIMRVKDSIVDYLDSHPAPMQASIQGQSGQEGYIAHTSAGPVKMINRIRFSAANFEH